MSTWQASAPSNLALIKYMGKTDARYNLPANPSLSLTLPNLTTTVTLNLIEGEDEWASETTSISTTGRERFLNHLQHLKSVFGIRGAFRISSENNFPSDCGLASSASSFAALTLAVDRAAQDLLGRGPSNVEQLSALARQGSGSASRSLFSPWALWDGISANTVDLPDLELTIVSIVVDHSRKTISSTQAHQRVTSSSLYTDRPQRAQTRLTALINAIQSNDWEKSFELIWADCMDMHALFETAIPSFRYLTPASWSVINRIFDHWQAHHDGPWMTCDAGPTVHIIFRPDQATMRTRLLAALEPFGKQIG